LNFRSRATDGTRALGPSMTASPLKADMNPLGRSVVPRMLPVLKPRSTTMPDDEARLSTVPSRTPWNKRKLIGAKPPLRPSMSGRSGPD
jgi:hypothetical protein